MGVGGSVPGSGREREHDHNGYKSYKGASYLLTDVHVWLVIEKWKSIVILLS